ncbi:MAG: PAS domain S-box protein [Acidobacteriota bacterium]
MIHPRPIPPWVAVAGATLLSVMACVLQWLIWPYVPTLLWMLFYPTVYICSWLGGLYGGFTAIAVGVILAWSVFVPTIAAPQKAWIPTSVFLATGTLFCWGHERMRQMDRRLQVMFAKSNDGIILADLQGRCQAANEATCELLRYSRAELTGLSVFDLVLPEDQARLRQSLDKIRQGAVDRLELTWAARNGEHVPVEVHTNVLPDDQWLINLRDIRQRKASEESLLRMRAELYEAQRLGKIGSWKWNRVTDEMSWSPELYRIYGLDPSKPVPSVQELEAMYTPASRQARSIALEQAMLTGHPYEAERELVMPNGEHRWLFVTIEGLRDPDGTIGNLRGTAQDITDRKQVELALLQSRRELRDVAAHREQEREQERKAIAREIHDELGQLLAAMRMDVSQLRAHCSEGHPAHPVLTDLNRLVERTFEVVRSLATSLRPAALDLGLVVALEWLVEDFSLRWDVPCELHLEGEPFDLDDMRATAIFRVIQESLTNVAKHARASHVRVALTFEPHQVSVSIRDDGCGFDVAQASARGRFGLLGMRERILALQGHIDVRSTPGKGTEIAMAVPTAPEKGQDA